MTLSVTFAADDLDGICIKIHQFLADRQRAEVDLAALDDGPLPPAVKRPRKAAGEPSKEAIAAGNEAQAPKRASAQDTLKSMFD